MQKSSSLRRGIVATFLGALTLLLGGPLVNFSDKAFAWGFQKPTTYGNPSKNTYILESTGNGAAIFDFDGDGRNDVLIANGTTLEAKPGEGAGLLLYRNEGPGRFRETSAAAGLNVPGWAQAACAADFDNDGKTDVAVTYYGFNRLFRNVGGRFEDVTKTAGLPVNGTRWGSGCGWID